MSETKPKKPRSTKSKAALEAKIAELEAKLSQLSSQVTPSEVRATPPPAKAPPKPKHAPKPAPSLGEVAPAYATISSTGYTGNKYYATRARLAYHPPNKQFRGGETMAEAPTPEPPKPKPKRGTLPAGFKP